MSIQLTTMGYCPEIIINSQNTNLVETNSTTTIIVKGEFLDQVENIQVTPTGSGVGTISNLTYIGHTELQFDLTVDATVDTYSILLEGVCNDTSLSDVQSLPITVVIPDSTGFAPELWVQSGGNNQSTVSLGTFEAQNSGGNGWNEHAYFGSVTSTSQINFEMTLDRLTGASSAYGFIRFNNTNNPSTGGNPKIYIENANTLLVYNSTGSSTNLGFVSTGDKIEVRFTPTTMEVFKNNVSIYTHTGSYNLTNMFVTFTAYRVLRATNIKLLVF